MSTFLEILQAAFIIMKILKLIDWSWFAVFSPLIIYLVVSIIYAFFL